MTVTLHTVALVAEIADHVGTRGSIGLGLALDGVEGAWPELIPGPETANQMQWIHARDRLAPFRDSSYRQTTTTTTAELANRYTAVKHPDNGLSDSLVLGNTLRENLLVLLGVAASRLGCSKATLERRIDLDPPSNEYVLIDR